MDASAGQKRRTDTISLSDEDAVRQVLVPPLASPDDMSIPRCVASGDEAIAALREHHDRWLRARAG
jgi:hypothetical protein